MHRKTALGAACALGLFIAACSGGGGSSGGGGGGGGTSVALSGQVTYQRVNHNATTNALDYSSISVLPVRGATVQARSGSSTTACSGGNVLASTTTDATGNYSLTVNSGATLKVCVRAEVLRADAGAGQPSWDVQVRDNTSGDAIYILESAALTPTAATTQNLLASTGWGGTGYTSTRAAAPFAILDSIYTAIQKVLTVDAATDFPALDVYWSVNNTNAGSVTNPSDVAAGRIGTSLYRADKIYVLGDDNNDTDEFDGHVIVHEYGHYVEDNLSRSDSIGGSHSGGDKLDLRVAYGEGFGNAWSGMVTGDPRYQDSFGNLQGQGFDINVETDTVFSSLDGWFNETSVQAILYDLYDSTNEGGASGDAVALGLGPLWSVWIGAQRTTPATTSIHSFLAALRSANAGSVAAIDALAAANDVHSTDEWGAGETNDGGLPGLALPVHSTYAIGQGSTVFCTTNQLGEPNMLGNRRLLRITPASNGTRTFSVTATGTNDADAVLFLAGAELKRSDAVGNESFQQSLTGGQSYVLEVYPFSNIDEVTSTGGTNVCVTVAIN